MSFYWRSLKRLKKLDRAQVPKDKDEGHVVENEEERGALDSFQPPKGRRCAERQWKPIQVFQMRQVFEAHDVPVDTEDDTDIDWIDKLKNE